MKLSVIKAIQSCLLLLAIVSLISGCGPIKTPVTNTYTLSLSPYKQQAKRHLPYTLLISKPDAMAGYRTEQMLYLKQAYKIEPFAKNAWQSAPANMLYPILVKRFQTSDAFRAISSSPYADKADYRLDTQLIEIYQDFTTKPSRLKFSAKIAMTRVSDNKVLGSNLIKENIACSKNNPYGGVVAANQAVSRFVEEALNFAIKQIQMDDAGSKT